MGPHVFFNCPVDYTDETAIGMEAGILPELIAATTESVEGVAAR